METSYIFAVIRYRRSVREYDPRPIEHWKLRAILEAARLAPSSTNSQPWRIVVVTDAGLRNEIARATPAGINRHPWMQNAPAILVLCAIKSGAQKFAQLIGKNYHLVDMGIAGEHMVLVAAELGLGSCWVGWIDKKRVKAILNIPLNWEVVCLIPVGYPKGESLPSDEVHARYATVEPLQREGEAGIGNTPANKRRAIEDTVFYDRFE